ncbi:MAG TPA: tetratricopeptide repeat protein [Treponemataceae bacterium]|nr:tetratricopeptide repeat protein [Treponemataceae bacterium]
MSLKRSALLTVFIVCNIILVFSQSSPSKAELPSSDFLVQGFEAYQRNDWPSALLYLRKAASLPQSSTAEVWYMLIMSQMYAGQYNEVLEDGDFFRRVFPESTYRPFIEYQIGRALYYTGKYDESIKCLGDFCVQYPSHEMYSSALFWMAESLYLTYYYDLARSLYERVITEYPHSSKTTECLYRIDVISQREKEEKLLYLLKVTGEEYLSSKEEYERQLKQYQTEESIGLRRQLNDSLLKISELEAALEEALRVQEQQKDKIEELNKNAEALRNQTPDSTADLDRQRQILELKEKAGLIQQALDAGQGE